MNHSTKQQSLFFISMFIMLVLLQYLLPMKEGHVGKMSLPGHRKFLSHFLKNDHKNFKIHNEQHKKNTNKYHRWNEFGNNELKY